MVLDLSSILSLLLDLFGLSVVRYCTERPGRCQRSKKRKWIVLAKMFPVYASKCVYHRKHLAVLACGGKALSARGRSGVHSSTEVGDDTTRITGTIPRGGRGIAVSQYAELQRVFTAEATLQYGRLIGDLNPIHLRGRGDFGKSSDGESDETIMTSKFRRIRNEDGKSEAVVHGMLVASLFSSIFGTLIPGSVYRSQRLEFRRPVFAGDTIIAKVEVTDVRNMKGRGSLVTCDTNIISNVSDGGRPITFVDGEAKVWLPGMNK